MRGHERSKLALGSHQLIEGAHLRDTTSLQDSGEMRSTNTCRQTNLHDYDLVNRVQVLQLMGYQHSRTAREDATQAVLEDCLADVRVLFANAKSTRKAQAVRVPDIREGKLCCNTTQMIVE